ncbi:hypothetical protein PG988_007791 [Apiospora saccharicola]
MWRAFSRGKATEARIHSRSSPVLRCQSTVQELVLPREHQSTALDILGVHTAPLRVNVPEQGSHTRVGARLGRVSPEDWDNALEPQAIETGEGREGSSSRLQRHAWDFHVLRAMENASLSVVSFCGCNVLVDEVNYQRDKLWNSKHLLRGA